MHAETNPEPTPFVYANHKDDEYNEDRYGECKLKEGKHP